MNNKDCQLIFSDGRKPYQFSSTVPLHLILDTAKERGWPVLAIKTPSYYLPILSLEAYETAVSETTFSDFGV